jgi:hypothetical protein
MKLKLENIQTKVGKVPNQSVELSDGNFDIIAIFESPTMMATVVDIDVDGKKVQNQVPVYNTLVITGSEPFIVFSVHYDRRYITRKFRNYR